MSEQLNIVILQARHMMDRKEYRQCEQLLKKSMAECPDDAVPHNLMGLLYEKQNNHIGAMKHFRAAWALDPTYRPALMNLDNFGTVHANQTYVFSEDQIQQNCGREAV
ncbi:MAG: hypothetical protein EOM64_00430 [Erysipelotrichia bacterium]|nr:hypothetical protein [Erysipelotrichia bacterium]